MSKKEKLIKRFKSHPKDFSFDELTSLLKHYGYEANNGGKTSGSLVRFHKQGSIDITIHKPHSYKCLLPAQINDILKELNKEEENE